MWIFSRDWFYHTPGTTGTRPVETRVALIARLSGRRSRGRLLLGVRRHCHESPLLTGGMSSCRITIKSASPTASPRRKNLSGHQLLRVDERADAQQRLNIIMGSRQTLTTLAPLPVVPAASCRRRDVACLVDVSDCKVTFHRVSSDRDRQRVLGGRMPPVRSLFPIPMVAGQYSRSPPVAAASCRRVDVACLVDLSDSKVTFHRVSTAQDMQRVFGGRMPPVRNIFPIPVVAGQCSRSPPVAAASCRRRDMACLVEVLDSKVTFHRVAPARDRQRVLGGRMPPVRFYLRKPVPVVAFQARLSRSALESLGRCSSTRWSICRILSQRCRPPRANRRMSKRMFRGTC